MKALLVDDEPLTLESLEAYVEWARLGIEEVRTASNGLEALDLLDGFRPDIVVSDVRMPRMNGIEFATKAKERLPDLKIIFLSGYSDKEYLKSAIHLKAVNYVEKPVKLDELTSALLESVSQSRAERANRTMTRTAVRQRLLGKLMKEELAVAELRRQFGDYVPAMFDGRVRAMAVRFALLADPRSKPSDSLQNELADRLQATIKASERAGKSEIFVGFEEGDTLLCLMDADRVDASGFKDIARELLYELNVRYGEWLTYAVGIGVGSPASGRVRECCLSALAAVRSEFYFGPGLVFSEPPPEARPDLARVAEGPFLEFRQALKSDNEELALAVVDRLTAELRAIRDPETGRVKNVFFRLLAMLVEFSSGKGLASADPGQEQSFIWREIAEIATLDGLRDYVIGNAQAVFSQIKEHSAVGARVGLIMQHIRERYADKELTTKSIAESTYLSQTYMCALFKKETGKTVNEYITEVRLDRARELLKDPRVKLYEVALSIGFTDANYFSSMFKKATGLTPSQYRDRR